MPKKFDKTRAKFAILSELLSFPTIRSREWSASMRDADLMIGDLVSLSSAPASKYYLGWLLEIECKPGNFTRYVIESVEDGSVCAWANVGINVYSRERVAERMTWRWSDRQFDFNARWQRVCRRDHDAYMLVPCYAKFTGEHAVELRLRVRHSMSEFVYARSFDDFRKVTKKLMSEFYLAGLSQYEEHLENAKRLRESSVETTKQGG